MKVICFDIGGTNLSKGVVELKEDGFEIIEYENVANPKNEIQIKEVLLSYSEEVSEKYGTKRIALSLARIVDPENKQVIQGEDIYGIDPFSLEFLEGAGFEIRMDNDARCFLLGEMRYGQGKAHSSVVGLTIGTGIGGAFGWNNKAIRLLHGGNSSAMEVSHNLELSPNADKEWAEQVSGRGVSNYFYQLADAKKSSYEIFQLAKTGNQFAKQAIEQAATSTGKAVANIINTLDPEIVVFGGGLSEQEEFIASVIQNAKMYLFNQSGQYKFAVSDLGRKANQVGAACLYLKEISM